MRILLIFIVILLNGCSFLSTDEEQSISPLLIGKKSPVKELLTIDNEHISLFSGQYKSTVLLFFNLDCSHCIDAINSIEQTIIPVMDNNNYQFIGIGIKHSDSYLHNWSKNNNIAMKLVSDEDKNIYQKFVNKGTPYFFILDRNGVVRVEHLGWSTRTIDYLRKGLMPRNIKKYNTV